MDNLISSKQAAEMLGLAAVTLAVWRYRGTPNIPYIKLGAKVMYRPEDIQAFIEKHTYSGTR